MSRKHNVFVFSALVLLSIVFFAGDLLAGSADLSLSEVLRLIAGGGDNSVHSLILFDFRLPAAFAALLVGAGLSVSGLLMQSLFRNPLAGPYVLGVSSGASLSVALFIMVGGLGIVAVSSSSWLLALFAITGSVAVLLLVMLISGRVRDSVSLLIVGIMLAGITSSVVSILQYFTTPELLRHFVVWTFGSLGGINYPQLAVILPVVLLGILSSVAMQKSLNSILLSDNYARLLGVSVKRLRLAIILTTGLMAGVITAFAGPVVFVGVAVPHLTRSMFRTSDHRILVPGTVLTGAVFMLLCDIASRSAGFDTPLPINAVSSLVGAPVIIWIVVKNRRLRTANF